YGSAAESRGGFAGGFDHVGADRVELVGGDAVGGAGDGEGGEGLAVPAEQRGADAVDALEALGAIDGETVTLHRRQPRQQLVARRRSRIASSEDSMRLWSAPRG